MELANGIEDLFDHYFFHYSRTRYEKVYEVLPLVSIFKLTIHSHLRGTLIQYG